MTMLARIRARLRRPADVLENDDLCQEIDHHIAMLADERLGPGITPEEADAFAHRKFGNRTSVMETVHQARPFSFLDAWITHLRMALRTLSRNKTAYLPAIAILTLGTGMSVAMFSLVDAVLLRPLPFPHQESIQMIWKTDPVAGVAIDELAYPELRDLQEGIPDFESVALMPTSLYGYSRVLENGSSEPVQIESTPVSHDFFRVLGVSPVLGRDFSDSDEHVGAQPVVIVSESVWRNQLGADPNVVGRLIRLSGQGFTVIGVLGPGVEFPRGAGLWVPLGVDPTVVDRRGATFLQAIARTRPGISHERIVAEVNDLFRRVAADHREAYTPSQRGVVTPLVEYWTGSARLHLWIMLGASVLLLTAAIISAGNLLLAGVLRRRHEIATQLALGARRRQVLGQLGTESVIVATVSALAGMGLAHPAIRLLVRWAPGDIPRLSQAALNLQSSFFAATVAVLCAAACTMIPGWVTTRMHLESTLREGGARVSATRGEGRTRNIFVLVQAGVTVMLLVLASLLVLSYRAMMSADIGFANRDALSMNLQLHGPGLFAIRAFDVKYRRAFYKELLDRLRHRPGVTSAAAVLVRPLEGPVGWDVSYEFGFANSGGDNRVLPKTNYEVVTPGYFTTIGTPLLEGRDFSEHDSDGGQPVAIISQSLAKRIQQAGFSPIGYKVRLGLAHDHWTKIVGVVADARYRSITRQGSDIFVPYTQAMQPTNYLVIRGKLTADELANLVRRTLASLDSTQTIAGISTIGDTIDANAARHRFNMILLLWFAVCAVILAAGGVYSVVAELIATREHEMMIKTCLGAPRLRLAREMVSGTLGFVLIGEALGSLGVLGVTRFAADLFYGVSLRDPAVFGSAAAFLFALSMFASVWPAWCAANQGGSENVFRRD